MEHIKQVMKYAGFPEEAQKFFVDLTPRLLSDSRVTNLVDLLVNKPIGNLNNEFLEPMNKLAADMSIDVSSFYMAVYLIATEPLLDKYRAQSIDERAFWDSTIDLRCKLIECRDNYGMWGTNPTSWHVGFYRLTRFALGRFQYDYSTFQRDFYSKKGYTIKRGEPCLQFHIPSSGPLVEADRMESYRRAYEFNRERFGGVLPIACSSWLLYPEHEDFLPPTSNLLGFMHDFDFLVGTDEEKFSNQWRVFGVQYDNAAPSDLPEKTSLQRAYKQRLVSGGKTGRGYGIFFWDENGKV